MQLKTNHLYRQNGRLYQCVVHQTAPDGETHGALVLLDISTVLTSYAKAFTLPDQFQLPTVPATTVAEIEDLGLAIGIHDLVIELVGTGYKVYFRNDPEHSETGEVLDSLIGRLIRRELPELCKPTEAARVQLREEGIRL